MAVVNQSEVARMVALIEAEYNAAEAALYGLATGTLRHDVISTRMGNAQIVGERLIEAIGKEAALPLIIAALDGTAS